MRYKGMIFVSVSALLRILIVSVLAYAALILVLRFAGKRALAKLNAFDFAVTVAFGSAFATILLSKDVALVEGLLAFVMLALLQWGLSRLSIESRWFRRAVRSRPALLVHDGAYCRRNLASERVTESEVEASVRKAGIGRIEDVAAVVLETDGSMSVIARGEHEPTVLSDVKR